MGEILIALAALLIALALLLALMPVRRGDVLPATREP